MQHRPNTDAVLLSMLCLLSIVFLTGCIRKPQIEQPLQQPVYLSHRITLPGETLGVISLWYTGDSTQWKNFFIPATSGTIRKLKRGDEILIPYELITNKEQITKEFIHDHKQMVSVPGSAKSKSHSKNINKEKVREALQEVPPEPQPTELAPLEVEQFEEKQSSPSALEKEFIDRIIQ